jgi:hypothetical protein
VTDRQYKLVVGGKLFALQLHLAPHHFHENVK